MTNEEIINELKDYSYIAKDLGTDVDLFFDSDKMYEELGYKPSIGFRNGYNYENEFLMMEISEDPDITELVDKIKIHPIDLQRIRKFVIEHMDILLKYANREVDLKEVYKKCKTLLNESKINLDEMAKFYAGQTGLYDTIWIDGGGTGNKSGHSGSPRIKYRVSGCSTHSDDWPYMTLDGYKTPMNVKNDWNSKELNKLHMFLDANKNVIQKAANEHWSYDKIASNLAVISKATGKLIYPNKAPDYGILRPAGFGWNLVQDKDNRLLNLEKDGALLPLWFKVLTPFNDINSDYALGFNNTNHTWYKITTGGKVKQTSF